METEIRANWDREEHRNLKDSRTVRAIDETGSATIARWRHKRSGAVARFEYEPDAERPYHFEIAEAGVSQRFDTRTDGHHGNKALLRDPEVLEMVELHRCEQETADGEPCQNPVDGPETPCHVHEDGQETEA